MREKAEKFYQWALLKAESQKASYWIALFFFLEIALFIPLDVVLIFFCLQNRKNTWLYASIAAVCSSFSGLIGYFLGHFLWDLISPYVIPYLISPTFFEKVNAHFQAFEHWAIFLGALLPFPLKALSLGAGVFQIGAQTFLFFFFAARILRFFAIGAVLWVWGEKVKSFLIKHFNKIALLLGAKVALALLFLFAIN